MSGNIRRIDFSIDGQVHEIMLLAYRPTFTKVKILLAQDSEVVKYSIQSTQNELCPTFLPSSQTGMRPSFPREEDEVPRDDDCPSVTIETIPYCVTFPSMFLKVILTQPLSLGNVRRKESLISSNQGVDLKGKSTSYLSSSIHKVKVNATPRPVQPIVTNFTFFLMII